MTHKILHTKNGVLHYWKTGRGPETLVFLHGVCLNHHIFKGQIDHFNKKFTVIALDLPKHGRSKDYSVFNYQEMALLMNHLLRIENIPAAHFIGESMGGYLLQYYAHHFPEKVASIVFSGSHPLGHNYYWTIEKWAFENMHRFVPYLSHRFIVHLVSFFSAKHQPAKLITKKSLHELSKVEIANLLRIVYTEFLSYRKPLTIEKNIPVLIIQGSRDFVWRIQWINRNWSREENYSLAVVKNAAHNANMDNYTHFNTLYDSFLNEIAATYSETVGESISSPIESYQK
ncbi:alpha/beta fold hydrolase [Lacticigenium naphthae]|uniref:alpha/beta fold hydrolase n=1 Tax=Lacticigenium naphthae TaxID=515351 RepID=UPI0003FC27D1|nr:alpha/beta hydrolase [Lacticigenium naphthae]